MAGDEFLNSSFATPEQIAQLRKYSELLQAESVKPEAKHWTGALAQALMGFRGQGTMDQANQLQRALLQQGAQGISNAGQTNPYVGVLMGNPSQPAASNAAPPAGNMPLKAAILQQESGNNPNIGNSSSGAMGPGQIMPDTFRAFAKQGEDIRNPLANREVSGRILDSYMTKYGDPERAAVAYFSGPGNVAPPGSPTPWLHDRKDPNGKSVSSYVADVRRRMGGGGQQQVAQGGMAEFYMNPSIPQALKDNVLKGTSPVPTEDVSGVPGVRQGTMGPTTATPVGPGFQPGFRAPASVSPEGGVSTTVANPAPGFGGPASSGQQLNNLYQTGQQFGQRTAASKPIRGGIESDIQQAVLVPQTRQLLKTMADDIQSHGDKMQWGPQADWVNNIKKGVAQFAPGLMSKEDIAGLASSDSFEKLSAQLQSIVGRQVGGTDASLLQGMRSVPNSHNSKEGALALIDMLDQVAQQNAKFAIENQHLIGAPGYNYLAAKNKFFEDNPIRNPLTGNTLRMDLSAKKKPAESSGGWGIVR